MKSTVYSSISVLPFLLQQRHFLRRAIFVLRNGAEEAPCDVESFQGYCRLFRQYKSDFGDRVEWIGVILNEEASLSCRNPLSIIRIDPR